MITYEPISQEKWEPYRKILARHEALFETIEEEDDDNEGSVAVGYLNKLTNYGKQKN